jgi:hypothetical protein
VYAHVWPSTPPAFAARHAVPLALPRSHAGIDGSLQPHCGSIVHGCIAQPLLASGARASGAAASALPRGASIRSGGPSPWLALAPPRAHAQSIAIATTLPRMGELLLAFRRRASGRH